jgi:Restriction endonuclease
MAARRGLGKRGKTWKTYEEVAAYVLKMVGKKFGLADVEGKQKVPGKATVWEIDAKGIQESDGALVIIECRRYTSSRLSQEDVGSIAIRIHDTGAAGGIIVSPHPLQRGAQKVSKAYNIQHVQLDPSSTRDNWIAKIQGVMTFGVTETTRLGMTDTLHAELRHAAGNIVEERSRGNAKT